MMQHSRLRGLYVITDRELCARRGIVASVEAALEGGARIVQYRDKTSDHERRSREARVLVERCNAHGAILLVNDDALLARQAGAHGVHIGREDDTLDAARELLGDTAIIGVSCYNEFARAEQATRAGANYVAFGSVFASQTKPDAPQAPLSLFARAREELGIASCAIGGIDHDNIAEISRAGAEMAAVISAVFAAADITAATRELANAFSRRS